MGWRIYSISLLIIQAALFFFLYLPNRTEVELWLANFYPDNKLLCIYLLLINIVTFVLYAIDKYKALTDKWRVREVTLLGFSFIGGAAGALLAMNICRHKIRNNLFSFGVPIMLFIQLVMIACLTSKLWVIVFQ